MLALALAGEAITDEAITDEAITDEASAVEALGHSPLLVECSIENFKVTWPEDFALAERLLLSRA